MSETPEEEKRTRNLDDLYEPHEPRPFGGLASGLVTVATVLIIVGLGAGIAAISTLSDLDVDFDVGALAVLEAVAPWVIAATVAGVGAEIVKAIDTTR